MSETPADPQYAQAWLTGTPPDQTVGFYIPKGNTGPPGPRGPIGPPGSGVPQGGSALDILRKTVDNKGTEWVPITKDLVGLNNVDNTTDIDKPVSTLTQQALDKKLPSDNGGALLYSPDGQAWRVTVGNDGALLATQITI